MLMRGWAWVRTKRGITLAEVLLASAITSIVLGGSLSAFITAVRIQDQSRSGAARLEASGYAQDLLDAYRNHVATDDTFFSSIPPNGKVGLGWLDDDPGTNPPSLPGPEIVKRVYRVDAADCDGDGVVAGVGAPPEQDCYSVSVRVCWNQPTCP